MTNNYLIYKHTSPSGKSYIGQTSTIRLTKRIWEHQNSDGCRAFSNAIQKYGFENFCTTILIENLTLEEANILEEQFIKEHNTLYPNGYNLKSGGLNQFCSNETKQKISNSKQGSHRSEETKQKISNTKKGVILSTTHCKNISKGKIGKPSTRKGTTLPESHIQNMKKPKSLEHSQNISKAKKGIKRSPESIEKQKATRKSNKETKLKASLIS